MVLLLDGVNNPQNIGALFRLADACGISKIFGYRLDVTQNMDKIDRVARQTTAKITFDMLSRLDEVETLFNDYYPIALEYTNLSIPFHQYQKSGKCVLVIGSEQQGVSQELLELCQISLHVPMLGQNSSMNVSVASGIVLYHLLGNFGKI